MNITFGLFELGAILVYLTPLILPGAIKAIAIGYLIGALHVRASGDEFQFSKKSAIWIGIGLLLLGLIVGFLCMAFLYQSQTNLGEKGSLFLPWPMVLMGYSLVIPMGYYYCVERYEDVAWERVTLAIIAIVAMDFISLFIEKYLTSKGY